MEFKKIINLDDFKLNNNIKNSKIIKDSIFLSNNFISYEINIKTNFIKNIFYNNLYLGNLPYNLKFSLKGYEILSKFGEPDEKLGGKYTYISIVYNRLGIEIKFDINHWNDKNAKIKFIVFFEPNLNNMKCGICNNKGVIECKDCKNIFYCSEICKNRHKNYHTPVCKI